MSKRKALGQGILVLVAFAVFYLILRDAGALALSLVFSSMGVAMIIMGLLYGR